MLKFFEVKVMGQITIDVPANTHLNFTASSIQAETLSKNIQNLGLEEIENPAIEPPRTSRKEGLNAAFGIWADREETGEETAKRIREGNRRIT
jgi:hypothetical protein